MGLAVSRYSEMAHLYDHGNVLNLSCASDENEFLTVNVFDLLAEELRKEGEKGQPALRTYPLNDPYAGGSLAGPVAAFFEADFGPEWITAGAGVGPLLCALVNLAGRDGIALLGETYPDFPLWALRSGIPIKSMSDLHSGGIPKADIIYVERPGLMRNIDLTQVGELCDFAAASSAIVIIDESNSNYLPTSYSAARFTRSYANLIVLRGMSKAYQLGSLRIGFAIAAPDLTRRLRDFVAPLQASSLSIRLASEILGLGDIFDPLRERIVIVRSELSPLLAALPFDSPARSETRLPYVFWTKDILPPQNFLNGIRVLGKIHDRWHADSKELVSSYRISLPLNEFRLNEFKARLNE